MRRAEATSIGTAAILIADECARLRALVADALAGLEELREYAASVWFDEATALDEERELMGRAKALAARLHEDTP